MDFKMHGTNINYVFFFYVSELPNIKQKKKIRQNLEQLIYIWGNYSCNYLIGEKNINNTHFIYLIILINAIFQCDVNYNIC